MEIDKSNINSTENELSYNNVISEIIFLEQVENRVQSIQTLTTTQTQSADVYHSY